MTADKKKPANWTVTAEGVFNAPPFKATLLKVTTCDECPWHDWHADRCTLTEKRVMAANPGVDGCTVPIGRPSAGVLAHCPLRNEAITICAAPDAAVTT